MSRLHILSFVSIVCALYGGRAFGSSDGCYNDGDILYYARPSLDSCSEDLPYLEPRNDSATNLKILLEAYVAGSWPAETPAESAEWGNPLLGSCQSNSEPTAKLFETAVSASSLSPEETTELVSLRKKLVEQPCASGTDFEAWHKDTHPTPPALSDAARPWLEYLRGAYMLYNNQPAEAAAVFATLADDGSPWLQETSRYLRARTLLISAQRNWDGYDYSLAGIDQTKIRQAEELLNSYLSRYPEGIYRASAHGLIRRSRRLRGDEEGFRAALLQSFDERVRPGRSAGLNELANELERFLPLWSREVPYEHPLLAADILLRLSRSESFGQNKISDEPTPPAGSLSGSSSSITASVLEKFEQTKDRYAPYPGLYDFIHATLLHAVGRNEEVASRRPVDGIPTVIHSSQLALIAEANEQLGRFEDAKAVWLTLIRRYYDPSREERPADAPPPAGASPFIVDHDVPANRLKTALLRNRLRAKALPEIAASDPGEYPGRPMLYLQLLSEEELRRTIENPESSPSAKDEAAVALLYLSLLGGKYDEFTKIYDTRPIVRSRFAEIAGAARTLATQPADPRALLDLGHYEENFDENEKNDGVQVGPTLNANSIFWEFAGKNGFRALAPELRPYQKYEQAKKVLDTLPQTAADLKAEALYRLIWCFRWSSCSYSISEGEVPKSTRQKWFRELKGRYPKTEWAKKTRYYF